MIEVPGAALSADALANESDFASSATNDLIQYTLGDRPHRRAGRLSLHAAPPGGIAPHTVRGRGGERRGIPISVCGEMAGDPRTGAAAGPGLRDCRWRRAASRASSSASAISIWWPRHGACAHPGPSRCRARLRPARRFNASLEPAQNRIPSSRESARRGRRKPEKMLAFLGNSRNGAGKFRGRAGGRCCRPRLSGTAPQIALLAGPRLERSGPGRPRYKYGNFTGGANERRQTRARQGEQRCNSAISR